MTRSIVAPAVASPTASPTASRSIAWVALVCLVALAACSSYDVPKDGPLRVTDAWARATNVSGTGAIYLTLENADTAAVMIRGAGTLIAAAAEFHETAKMQGMAGMTHMTRLDSIPIARGATLTMQPGGLHIMLIDLKMAIAPGDTVPLVIQLGDGRTTSVEAVVREK